MSFFLFTVAVFSASLAIVGKADINFSIFNSFYFDNIIYFSFLINIRYLVQLYNFYFLGNLVNQNVPKPYMDEIFHVPQVSAD